MRAMMCGPRRRPNSQHSRFAKARNTISEAAKTERVAGGDFECSGARSRTRNSRITIATSMRYRFRSVLRLVRGAPDAVTKLHIGYLFIIHDAAQDYLRELDDQGWSRKVLRIKEK